MVSAHGETRPKDGVLGRLSGVLEKRGLDDLAATLSALASYAGADLAAVEGELAHLPRSEDLVGLSASHLLVRGGKRLRPLCVALAAKVGTGFGRPALELAVAVELVHNATLLHDDVIDQGALRRGAPTSRMLYGNAASVYAGDWLLVEALRRVVRAGVPGLLESLLTTIDEMIAGEAIQLERRGKLVADPGAYFQIIEKKTASLFRYAMAAGARAGGLGTNETRALEAYGRHLGLAFQLIDDALDLSGETESTGKALFTDLREGKLTYPLLVGLERDPDLHGMVQEALAREEEPLPAGLGARIQRALNESGALPATTRLAEQHVAEARAALAAVPDGPARAALLQVAEAAVHRRA
ncbi:MAG: polyprenyl synthetase family protein [Deltaproteobacteria bacterium]|jgi:octaprenyl-diphosphate synthase|nr:polyprenyl synthetase family protein [Deltaproteobacteria bacterium]